MQKTGYLWIVVQKVARRLMNRLPKNEKSVINNHIFHNATRFAVMLMRTKRGFLHSIGYQNCIKKHIRLDLLLILAHARLPNYQNC